MVNRWYHPLKIVNCFKTHHRIERTKKCLIVSINRLHDVYSVLF